MAESGAESWTISQAEKQAILERQAIRDNLRRGFQRQINDPTFKGFLVRISIRVLEISRGLHWLSIK